MCSVLSWEHYINVYLCGFVRLSLLLGLLNDHRLCLVIKANINCESEQLIYCKHWCFYAANN